MKTSRDDVIQLQQCLDDAFLSSLPFAAIADSPNMLLERILVDEIFSLFLSLLHDVGYSAAPLVEWFPCQAFPECSGLSLSIEHAC
jgi:hypothetical protein